MNKKIEYFDITIHQRISLKGLIQNKLDRRDFGFTPNSRMDKTLDMLHLLALLNNNYRESINILLEKISEN